MADTAVAAAERTLPHNLEAERSVLGAILVHNDAFNLAAQVIDSGDFYRDAHRRIFDRMVALNERHDAIDFVTLKEELSRAGELDEVGGPAYVAVARRRRAARDQRRVLRAHRQREVDAAKSDLRREQDRRQRVRGRTGIRPDPGRSRERDLRRGRRPAEGRLRGDARSGQGQLPEDRKAFRAEAADHRRAHRLRRRRRDDARPAGWRPDHRRGPPVDGEDEPRAQHRAVRGRARRTRSSASSAWKCRRSRCFFAC